MACHPSQALSHNINQALNDFPALTAASVGEREGGKQVLQRTQQMGKAVARLHMVWVDGSFDGNP